MIRRRFTGRDDATLGAVVMAFVVVASIAVFTGVLGGALSSTSTRSVSATFADAQQVRPGTEIRIDGIEAGEVAYVELGASNRTTTIKMDVRTDVGPLYEDATAVLRFKTLLGGVFYVDLERGTAGSPELGDRPIPVERTARQVEVDDVTAAFGGGARAGLKAIPREMAEALGDPAPVGRLLRQAADSSPSLETAVRALRGRREDTDLRDLLANTAKTVEALDAPRGRIRDVVEGAAETLAVTAARGDDVRAFLRDSPPAGREVDATLDRLQGTLDGLDPLVDDLQEPARALAPTFAAVRPVVAGADRLLARSTPLLRSLRPAAASLAGTATRGTKLLDELDASIGRTNTSILPMLSEIDEGTQKSTAVMIGGTFAGLGSGAGGQMDVNGHFIRFPATSGSSPVNSLPCQTYLFNPDVEQLTACNTLGEALQAVLTYNPIGPVPGTEPRSAREGGR